MEHLDQISGMLDALLSLATPRPDLITPGSLAPGILDMPRPATFAGRVIFKGQKPDPAELLSTMPMSGVPGEEGLVAPVATMSSFGLGASLKNLASKLKGKFPTAAVNEAGEPKLLFHGTSRAFSEFDPGKAREGLYGPGVYLTENPSVASGYAGATERGGFGVGRAPNVRPSFVRIQKPFDIDALPPSELVKKVNTKLDLGFQGKWKTGGELFADLAHHFEGAAEVVDWLRANGFDGITHIGGKISGGIPHRVWIAFNPSQVVSAFDPILQPQTVTGGTLLPPNITKALTTPGKSEFTVTIPKKLK